MIGVEDDLEGGEDKQSGKSRKPQKGRKKKMGGHDVVGPLRNIMMIAESQRFMTVTPGDPP